MSARSIQLDFVARRAPLTLVSGALLLLGISAAAGAYLGYRHLESRRAGLELKLDAAQRRAHRDPALDLRAAGMSADAGRVAEELSTPWTKLLAELEAASGDSGGQIAVLSIEPDHAKRLVHLTAESRDLPTAIAYVERLQKSTLLRYPMLDGHDVRTDDPQRPVRFALSAEWREAP
ncbi:MAG TPA: hypothetical protein VFK87_03615 [Steroidobacteraceae bacterium]|nr:hypothetical protein [Steroidobacteraceae bacterium]